MNQVNKFWFQKSEYSKNVQLLVIFSTFQNIMKQNIILKFIKGSIFKSVATKLKTNDCD